MIFTFILALRFSKKFKAIKSMGFCSSFFLINLIKIIKLLFYVQSFNNVSKNNYVYTIILNYLFCEMLKIVSQILIAIIKDVIITIISI